MIEGDAWAYRNPYEHLAGTGAQMSRRVRSAGFVERRFNVGGIGINYVVGPDHGPPLVLLPAQMGTWETYESARWDLRGIPDVHRGGVRAGMWP
ncbi:MAG: hypothetical protein L0K86_27500 [Actinomycetia bacterium]|nr:hypothetical protein [Actinomycetes bacterium]